MYSAQLIIKQGTFLVCEWDGLFCIPNSTHMKLKNKTQGGIFIIIIQHSSFVHHATCLCLLMYVDKW